MTVSPKITPNIGTMHSGACSTLLAHQFPGHTCNLNRKKNPREFMSSPPMTSIPFPVNVQFSLRLRFLRRETSGSCFLWLPMCCVARPPLIGRRKAGNYSRLGRDVSGLSLFSKHFPEVPRWRLVEARLSHSILYRQTSKSNRNDRSLHFRLIL